MLRCADVRILYGGSVKACERAGNFRDAGCRRRTDRRRIAQGRRIFEDLRCGASALRSRTSNMNWYRQQRSSVHILLAAGIVGLVLLQRGKGADAGAGFGAGASGTVFGARGSASFLSRTTASSRRCSFVTSLGLAYLGGRTDCAEQRDRPRAGCPTPAAADDAAAQLCRTLPSAACERSERCRSSRAPAPAPEPRRSRTRVEEVHRRSRAYGADVVELVDTLL